MAVAPSGEYQSSLYLSLRKAGRQSVSTEIVEMCFYWFPKNNCFLDTVRVYNERRYEHLHSPCIHIMLLHVYNERRYEHLHAPCIHIMLLHVYNERRYEHLHAPCIHIMLLHVREDMNTYMLRAFI